MKHLEAAFTGNNKLWTYVVMLAAIFLAINTVGSIPLLISLGKGLLNDPGMMTKLSENPNDLSAFMKDPIYTLFALIFAFMTGLAAFILLVKPLNKRSVMQVINGGRPFRWKNFIISSLAWLIISTVYVVIYLKTEPDNFSRNPDLSRFVTLVLVSVLFIPFQAAFEEVIFRGYLMQGFGLLVRNRIFPLLCTSVLFALLHSANPEVKAFGFWTMMPQYLLFGLIFGIMTIMDDGVEAAIGAHAVNNTFLSIFITHESSALQTPALYEQHTIYPWTDFTGMLITGALLLIVFKVVFRWGSFRTLFGKIEKPPLEPQSPYTEVLSSHL